ncbi:MAG: glycogen synthase GlgA [Alphaproteobacteria bacterium]
MRVLHAAAELYPLVKTGGLGDVTAALPAALAAQGVDARLLLPGFPGFMRGLAGVRPLAPLPAPHWAGPATLCEARVPESGLLAYLVDAPALYDRPGHVYLGPDGRDWPDSHRRFALLGMAAAALAEGFDPAWAPDVVHAHDWHAALAPVYLRVAGGGAASVLTIHNLAFQGLFPASAFADLDLPAMLFGLDGLEFWGRVSFLKGGLLAADRLTTVSPTYAAEILTPEHGMGLDGVLRGRAADLAGILNGVDYAVWDPARDPLLAAPYDAADPAGKAACRTALERACGWAPDPGALVLGAVTRLTEQKGFDLVLAAAESLAALGCRLVLLGSGEADLEAGFRRLADAAPDRVWVHIGYDEALAHRIYGGADAMLVPSRFEPCGLTQLYAMRYGTLPVVRRTGGLADTVDDLGGRDRVPAGGTGFAFAAVEVDALLGAVARAVAARADAPRWAAARRRAMTADFGWPRAAAHYADLYRSLRPS